jgi:peptide-methionine (S)-S-oxide reductase
LTETAIFAAGCFWGIEETFRTAEGVIATEVGYTGGKTVDPTYEQICTGRTGHAEAVRVEFDPDIVDYDALVEMFWTVHDPTTLNRQGWDRGTQYRSAIYFNSDEQRRKAMASRERMGASGRLSRPIVTEITGATAFFRAEEYHQKYVMKGGPAACRTGGMPMLF